MKKRNKTIMIILGILVIFGVLANSSNISNNSVSVKELSLNPERYLYKEITLTGKVDLSVSSDYRIWDNAGYSFPFNIKVARPAYGQKYTITGVVEVDGNTKEGYSLFVTNVK